MTIEALLTHPALAGMRQLRQWMIYTAYPDEKKPGKLAKLPLHPATGSPCSVVEPANWSDIETAAASVRRFGPGFGLAFCFTENDPYWFIDLDGCKQADGSWSPLAQQLVAQVLPGAAVEISASGNGLHLFGRGAVPQHASKNMDQRAELYTRGRFCAMTGTALQGNCDVDHTAAMQWVVATYFAPKNPGAQNLPTDGPRADWRGPTDDAELLRRALQSKTVAAKFGAATAASFADLWHADLEVLHRLYPGDGEGGVDRSSVDMALAQHLAFWTGCDQARMVSLMQQSALVREKWEREDYLPRTVASACALQRDVLQDKPVVSPLAASPVSPLAPAAPTPPAPPAAAPSGPPGPPAGPAAAPPVPPGPPVPAAPAAPVEREGTTFIRPDQAATLFAGCFYLADTHRVLVPGGKIYKPEQFKAVFGGFTFIMDATNNRTSRDAFEAFTQNQVFRPPIVDGTAFKPALPYGQIITSEGRSRANMFCPAQVERRPGDVSRFLRHMEILFPNEKDRAYLLYWMAHCVQHPGVKSQWMPLLVGSEGNGKSLFSRCLAYAVGHRYTHWPDASKLGGSFNAWVYGKLLVCIEDLLIGEALEVWEKLKPMITGESLEIEAKGIDQRTDEVCCNIIANSNHKNAIRATLNDRRVCHLWSAQQSAADNIRDGLTEAYMSSIYDWLKLEGGYAAVAHFLATLEIPPLYGLSWFMGRAPKTSYHYAAVEASRGPIEQEVNEAIERGDVGFCGGWVSSGALDRLLERVCRNRPLAPNKRREVMQNLGYDWHPALPSGRVNNPVLPDNAKVKLFVRLDSAHRHLTTAAEVAQAYTQAQMSALAAGGASAPSR